MTRAILTTVFACALLAAPSFAEEKQSLSSSDSFTLAVMRTDGILLPVARHAEGEFKSFWPEYDEFSKKDVMSSSQLPAEWLENWFPSSEKWFYMDFNGNKKHIALSETVNDLRCDDSWGVDTDIEKKPYECEYCCPYPKIGIASDRDLDISPVIKTDMTNPFTEYFKRLHGEDVMSRLSKVLKEKSELSVKADPSIEERMVLEPNEISIYKVTQGAAIYFYEMILVHDLDNYVAGCPDFDVRQGWTWENESGELKSISTEITPTDCDFQGSAFMTPRANFTFNGKRYVVMEKLGYESETWAVYEVNEDKIKVVASTMTHAI